MPTSFIRGTHFQLGETASRLAILCLLAQLSSSLAAQVNRDDSSSASLDLRQIAAKARRSVVTIEGRSADGRAVSQGTGFFISGQRLITNRHVMKGVSQAIARTADGKTLPVRCVVAEDAQRDLVALRTDGEEIPELELRIETPADGTRVVVVGSPLGLGHTVCDGIVSAVRSMPFLETVVQVTAPISPGSSGSPILDLNGLVLGVASARHDGGENIGFGISSQHVKNLRDTPAKPLATWSQELMLPGSEGFSVALIIGLILVEQYHPLDALPYLFVAAQDHSPVAWYHIGLCMHRLRRHSEAAAAFLRSAEGAPERSLAWYHLCLEYRHLNLDAELLRVFMERFQHDSFLHTRPPQAQTTSLSNQAWHGNINRLDVRGRLESLLVGRGAEHAEVQFAYALSLPHDLSVASSTSYPEELEARKQSLKLKIKAFEDAIHLDPTNAAAWCQLGHVYRVEQRFMEAAHTFKEATKLQPTRTDFLQILALTLNSLERFDESVEVLKRAIARSPESSRSYFLLGQAYEALGRWGDSIDSFRESARRATNSWRPKDALSRVFERAGNSPEALKAAREAHSVISNQHATFLRLLDSFGEQDQPSGKLWCGIFLIWQLQTEDDELSQQPRSEVILSLVRNLLLNE